MNKQKRPSAAANRAKAKRLRRKARPTNSTQLWFNFVETRSKLHCDILSLFEQHETLSRQEIADLLNRAVQSVTQPVLDFIKTQQLVETGKVRKTRFGGNARLLSLPGGDR